MEKVWSATAGVARAAAWAGGAMLLAAAGIVSTEVVLRKILTVTFTGSDEIASYLFAVGTSWALAHVLVTRGHVRIDALYLRFGPRVRAALDLASLLTLALFVAFLTERAWNLAFTSLFEWIRPNTALRVPLAIPQLAWLAGFLFFLFTLAVAILRVLAGLARGDLAAVAAIAGASTQDEEIESELRGLGIAPPAAGDGGRS